MKSSERPVEKTSTRRPVREDQSRRPVREDQSRRPVEKTSREDQYEKTSREDQYEKTSREDHYSNYGGADLNKVLNICARIKPGDEQGWMREWSAAAERARQNADPFEETSWLTHSLFDKSTDSFLEAMQQQQLGPGYDSTKEEAWFAIGAAARWNEDWENVLVPVLDFVTTTTSLAGEVDTD
ncbi:hypothetical protein DV735_g2166, partial [Chaetothyriales sp. CBS 134920]